MNSNKIDAMLDSLLGSIVKHAWILRAVAFGFFVWSAINFRASFEANVSNIKDYRLEFPWLYDLLGFYPNYGSFLIYAGIVTLVFQSSFVIWAKYAYPHFHTLKVLLKRGITLDARDDATLLRRTRFLMGVFYVMVAPWTVMYGLDIAAQYIGLVGPGYNFFASFNSFVWGSAMFVVSVFLAVVVEFLLWLSTNIQSLDDNLSSDAIVDKYIGGAQKHTSKSTRDLSAETP